MKKLGFGCMRLPLRDADVQKDVDMGQVCQMVDTFLQRGFTYFDTAYMLSLIHICRSRVWWAGIKTRVWWGRSSAGRNILASIPAIGWSTTRAGWPPAGRSRENYCGARGSPLRMRHM